MPVSGWSCVLYLPMAFHWVHCLLHLPRNPRHDSRRDRCTHVCLFLALRGHAASVPYALFGTWTQALCLARCHVSLYCLTCLLSLPGVQSLSIADLSSHAHRCREAGLRMSSGAMHPELRR